MKIEHLKDEVLFRILKDRNVDETHVYPAQDLYPHCLVGTECSCHPYFDEDEPDVLIHRAFDLRDLFEYNTPIMWLAD